MKRAIKVLLAGWIGILALQTLGFGYDKKPFIIVVAGGSASGKTYTAKLLVEALGKDRATLLSADHYYAPEKQPKEFYLNGGINYDHPSAVDLKKLALHLKYLRSGFPISVKEYTYGRTDVPERFETFLPKEFIVVEGIFALYPEIANLADFRIFVDVDKDTRFARRLARDQKERGLAPEAVKKYFDEVVEPMHQKYIQPSALRADVIVDSPSDREKMKEVISVITHLSQRNRSTKFDILSQSYSAALEELMQGATSDYKVLEMDQLHPTQPEIGYLNLSNKAYVVDNLIRASSVEFDLPSKLVAFLKANPIPVVKKGDSYFVIDHHHLLLALNHKGITKFYSQIVEVPATVDLNQKLTWQDLRNNTYRSLAGLVRDLGHIRKTGRPYEEFEWAAYFKERFENEMKTAVTEDSLLEPDLRDKAVASAIAFARAPEAAKLPGFLGSPCAEALIKPKL